MPQARGAERATGPHTCAVYQRRAPPTASYRVIATAFHSPQGDGTDHATVQQIRDAIRTGTEITVRILNYTKQGKPFWNMFTMAPMCDQEGKVRFFVGVQVRGRARAWARVRVGLYGCSPGKTRCWRGRLWRDARPQQIDMVLGMCYVEGGPAKEWRLAGCHQPGSRERTWEAWGLGARGRFAGRDRGEHTVSVVVIRGAAVRQGRVSGSITAAEGPLWILCVSYTKHWATRMLDCTHLMASPAFVTHALASVRT